MKTRTLAIIAGASVAVAIPAIAQQANEPPQGKSNAEIVREGNQAPIAPRQFDKPFPTGMNWVATSLNGKPLAAGRERPSFVLDEQLRARGFGGCNNFSVVAYPLRAQKFAVGPIAHTNKPACDKAAAAQERAFFVALRTSNTWDLDSGFLVLKGQGGELRFERGI